MEPSPRPAPEPDALDDDPRILEVSRDYLAALEAGASPDRASYLARYPELASEIEECLDGVELAHSLRRAVPMEPAVESPAAIRGAEPLGDFKIVRELGRGGMGAVYEATQLSLGRRVALKVLPFAAALDERQRQRFQLEAQAAAQLHHPHIVPVYAVGCDRGTHYYAMQLINGQPLSHWIASFRSDSGQAGADEETQPLGPRDEAASATLSQQAASTATGGAVPSSTWFAGGSERRRFRAAAAAAAQVADALEYAHNAGVIHRDIKPANLLVDEAGNVWITDFGLAQISANSSMTRTGDLLGTLRYMSPEQAAGRRTMVDHRCDIYALGATLYELLALQPMFPGQDRQTLLHAILNEEPPPLRKLLRTLPVELETIVMKATAKAPGERYATAGELAADLRNFLDERPIQARRPTVVDHVRKWMRRHPAVVAATLLVLLIGILGLSFAVAAVSREKTNTQNALAREQRRAREAEARLQLAQRAADDMIALAEFELSDEPWSASLRKKLLEAALEHYQAFIQEQAENPAAASQLTETRDRVQKILDDLLLLKAERESALLHQPDVLADLKIDEGQYEALREWMQQSERWRRPANSLAVRKEQMLERARSSRDALLKILAPAQQQRLTQLSLQLQGVQALHESEVVAALALSDQQRAQIHDIETQARFENRFRRFPSSPFGRRGGGREGGRGPGPRGGRGPGPKGPGPLDPPPPEDNPPGREELWNDPATMAACLQVLTPEQRKVWAELIGEPFRGQLVPTRFRPL